MDTQQSATFGLHQELSRQAGRIYRCPTNSRSTEGTIISNNSNYFVYMGLHSRNNNTDTEAIKHMESLTNILSKRASPVTW